MIILRPAIEASLNSYASIQAKHNSFQVFGELAFFAESIAYWYCPSLTKQDAILALFLMFVKKILAALYNFSS